jgi:hypothetical protein
MPRRLCGSESEFFDEFRLGVAGVDGFDDDVADIRGNRSSAFESLEDAALQRGVIGLSERNEDVRFRKREPQERAALALNEATLKGSPLSIENQRFAWLIHASADKGWPRSGGQILRKFQNRSQ